MKSYSSREVIQKLNQDGWYEVGCEGDHHQFKHPVKKGKGYGDAPQKRYSGRYIAKHRKSVGRALRIKEVLL